MALGSVAFPSVVGALLCTIAFAVKKAFFRKEAGKSSDVSTISTVEPKVKNGDYGVYPLYEPAGDVRATMDIVFFHGLQINRVTAKDAWWTTWLSRDGAVCWPQKWLPKEFPKARIFSVSYPAKAVCDLKTDGKLHWETLAIDILNQLQSAQVDVGGSGRQVVLIGHSMGGLVLKQVLCEAHSRATSNIEPSQKDKATRFRQNMRGLVFYATPHSGSALKAWADNPVMRLVFGTPNKALLDRLEVFDPSTHLLQGRNEGIFDRAKCLCFAEQLPMNLGVLGSRIVVEPGSAMLCPTVDQTINADHNNVCRPEGETDMSYIALKEYVQNVTKSTAERMIMMTEEEVLL